MEIVLASAAWEEIDTVVEVCGWKRKREREREKTKDLGKYYLWGKEKLPMVTKIICSKLKIIIVGWRNRPQINSVLRVHLNYMNKESLKLMHVQILTKVKNDLQYDNRKKG